MVWMTMHDKLAVSVTSCFGSNGGVLVHCPSLQLWSKKGWILDSVHDPEGGHKVRKSTGM